MNTSLTMSRRRLLGGALALGVPAALALTGCGRDGPKTSGAGDRSLRLALGWLPDVSSAGLWLASERGLFRNGGIDLSYQAGGPNTPPTVETVSSGHAAVGEQGNMQTFFDAVIKGNDLVLIGTKFQRNPAGLLSLADKPVLKAEDLLGKRVLAPSPVDAESIKTLLKMNGLPENDFKFIQSGSSPEPLLQKQGDVMVVVLTNQPVILELQKGMTADRDFFFRTYDDFGLPRYSSVMFTTRKFTAENHDLLVAFMKALRSGWTENERDPKVAAQLTVDKYGQDLGLQLKQQTRQNELQIPLLRSEDTGQHGLFWIDKDRLGGPMYDALRAAGRTNLPDVDSLVDMTILEDAGK